MRYGSACVAVGSGGCLCGLRWKRRRSFSLLVIDNVDPRLIEG